MKPLASDFGNLKPHPSLFSPGTANSTVSNLHNYYHAYRYRIFTFDQHFGYTLDRAAYPHSITAEKVNRTNLTNSHCIINMNKVTLDENQEIMKWLSPLDPARRHQDVRTDRLDSVGNWLLETKEFREWRSNEDGADKAVLFCYGDPGVGKTYLR